MLCLCFIESKNCAEAFGVFNDLINYHEEETEIATIMTHVFAKLSSKNGILGTMANQ